MTTKRGEIWLAELNPTRGSEQAGTRPVLIFQNDMVSKFTATVLAIPLTTNLRRASLPSCVRVSKNPPRLMHDCSVRLEEFRLRGGFDVTCQGTVPAAAVAFLESKDFEDTVRNAVSLGGDADTLACIAGGLAEPFYGGVPAEIQREVMRRLDPALRSEVFAFAEKYRTPIAAGASLDPEQP
jgi:mRNA-degrading endonuclease toxin of MazEF toxin-antitoxin module